MSLRRSRLFHGITPNVVVLGLVSFFTDVSSEMIYPLLPLFLTSVLGAGPALLGLIEGVAETTASLLKLVSGHWSDRIRNRTRLVLAGYGLSAFSRPFIAATTSAYLVLFVRVADRIGKGLRTAPRDALIADSVALEHRGKAFGYQRSMDHAGAVVGPLIATVFLARTVNDLRALFWLAAIPGIIAVLFITFWVREIRPGTRIPLHHNGHLPAPFPTGDLRRYLLILLLFTLGNSSDAFLLLRAADLGVPPIQLPLLWTALHVVKMGATMPFGALSDRLGRRRMILAGWGVYALAYAGFAAAEQAWHAWALFPFYGLFFGLTEGVERALMADLSKTRDRGGAFGWYNFIVGIGALPASLLFGLIWQAAGPREAFSFGAAVALLSVALLYIYVRPNGAKAHV